MKKGESNMQDNIEEMITKTFTIDKEPLKKHVKELVLALKKAIEENKDLIEKASEIDIREHNGFSLDWNGIENILTRIKKEDILYGNTILSELDKEQEILYGKEITSLGTVLVIHDSSPYTLLEMMIRNILAGNSLILVNDGYMQGTNEFLVQICRDVLERFSISRNLVQLYITNNYEEVFEHTSNIDLIIAIGDRVLQNNVLSKSRIKTITSGYENFDLYIEDTKNIDFIRKILENCANIQVYVKEGISFSTEKSITVLDIDEAIAQINYMGNGYSAAIFTASKENASQFVKEIKCSQVVVNASPTIERVLDINQRDLGKEKTIIYPALFHVENNENKK